MEITSYLLGKKAGGGGSEPTGTIEITSNGTKNVKDYASANVNVQPDLETKSVTITENGTTTVSPTSGKDGLSQVEITTNVSGGGGDVSKYVNTNIDAPLNFANKIIKKFPTLTVADGVTSLSGAFWNTVYSDMSFEGIDCSNITDMDSMFSGNSSLVTIDLANITNTLNVRKISYIFSGDGKIETISNVFPLTGNDINCASAFRTCYELKSLDLSNWNITLTYSYSSQMFYQTRKLAILDVSNITFPSSFGLTFSECGSQCLQSDGAYADGIPYIYVKDATEQAKVIAANSSTWSTDNVIVKSN